MALGRAGHIGAVAVIRMGGILRAADRPFSVWVSLRRNPLRTLPIMLATTVASLGVASVVVLANSIVRTAVAPNDFLRESVMINAEAPTIEAAERFVRTETPRSVATRIGPPSFVRGHLLQFDMFFPVLLLPDGQAEAVLARYGDRLSAGRMPAPGTLEIALPVGLARSRHAVIGQTLGGPDDFTPLPLKLVGLIDGPRWIGIGSASGVRAATQSVLEGLVIFEPDGDRRASLEAGLRARFGNAADIRHWTPKNDGKDDVTYVDDLRFLLSFIIGINASVLAIVGGLLAILYFRQRQAELVLLSLLGWSKLQLARRMLSETAIVVGAGWATGILATYVLLSALRDSVFADRAVFLDLSDWGLFLNTLPLAIITFAVSATVTAIAVAGFDPIARLHSRE